MIGLNSKETLKTKNTFQIQDILAQIFLFGTANPTFHNIMIMICISNKSRLMRSSKVENS
jgi:hypothetical protein